MPRISQLKNFVKTLLVTRSPRSTWRLFTRTQRQAVISAAGLPRFHVRTGTTDSGHLRLALTSDFDLFEYNIHIPLQPKTILDIGANIGITAVSYARRYPDARIFAFEPFLPNYELLELNTASYPRITALSYGLGVSHCEQTYYCSDDELNFAGGTFYPVAENLDRPNVRLTLRTPQDFLDEHPLTDIDLIKIDTEGAENDILQSFPTDMLSRVKVIVGELHDVEDEQLITYLEQWFDVQRQHVQGRLSFFQAVNHAMDQHNRVPPNLVGSECG